MIKLPMKKSFIFNIFLITFMLLPFAIEAKPVAAVAYISWDSNRSMALASLIEEHTLRILKETELFDTIDSKVINKELSKFNCFDEKCLSGFAKNAEIHLLISGNIEDRNSYLILNLRAHGSNRIYNGNLIYSATIKIPLKYPSGSREFSLLCEEQSANFIIKTLQRFHHDIAIKKVNGTSLLQEDIKLSGTFPLCQKNITGEVIKLSDVTISNGKITSEVNLQENSFLLINFVSKSEELKKYYTSRKQELLFAYSSITNTAYLAILTPFASASMPFASPFLGYYMHEDWKGLGLWMINASPYLYMEAMGFYNSPSRLKEKDKDISRDNRAMNYFAWYMLTIGGLPLFIDSYAFSYLEESKSSYKQSSFLGNRYSAIYLSLISNGGGMFYKGHRYWGYFYFHLNNILLYSAMREFSREEIYDQNTDSYKKGSNNTSKAKKICYLLSLTKLTEVIHTALSREDLSNSSIIDEYFIPSPFISLDLENNAIYGIALSYKF
jgi:hypothetical protein